MKTNNEIFKKTLKEIIDNVNNIEHPRYFSNSVTCKFSQACNIKKILKISLIEKDKKIYSIKVSLINKELGNIIDEDIINFKNVYGIDNSNNIPIMILDSGFIGCSNLYYWNNITGKPDLSKISDVINNFIDNYI